MADVTIAGSTYSDVETVALTNTDGEEVLFTIGGTGEGYVDVTLDENGDIKISGGGNSSSGSSVSSDWELVEELTIEQTVTSIGFAEDYSEYNEVIVQAMLTPVEDLTSNFVVKVYNSDTLNDVRNVWGKGIGLTESPKSTEKTSFGFLHMKKTNIGIFAEIYKSFNYSSVNTFLFNWENSYSVRVRQAFDENGTEMSANTLHSDFGTIASLPSTNFKYLCVGSYQPCISVGSKFKIYGRK